MENSDPFKLSSEAELRSDSTAKREPARGRLRVLAFALPTLISLVSLGAAVASWHEANKANELNSERLRIVLRPDLGADSPVGTPLCGYTMILPLTWRALLYNNSAQPVTIENIEYIGFSSNGILTPIGADIPAARIGFRIPTTIPAKGFESFPITANVNAPKAYAEWYRRKGLCDTRVLDRRNAIRESGFTETGGTAGNPSNAGVAVKVRTSDGYEVTAQAQWDDPIRTTGPYLNLPAQSN